MTLIAFKVYLLIFLVNTINYCILHQISLDNNSSTKILAKEILHVEVPICNHLSMYHDETGCKQASCGCIKTAKDLRGETRIPPFRSIGRITKWVVRFIIATIILTIISLAVSAPHVAGTAIDPYPYTFEEDPVLEYSNIIQNIITIVSILAWIFGLFWYYRASKNIHSFGAKQVWRPILSVIWWLIPPLSLYLPYDVTQQFWKVSNPQTKLVNGMEWKDVPSSNMIKLWWTLTLVSLLGMFVFTLGLGFAVISHYSDINPEPFFDSFGTRLSIIIISISFDILLIISEIYLIKIIRQISTWQELKHSNLSTSTSV